MSQHIIYLDTSVVSDLEAGRLPDLLAVLEASRESLVLPFSAAHIQDAKSISPEPLRSRRIAFLDRLSRRAYLYDGLGASLPEFRNESPARVLELLSEVPFADTATEALLGLIPEFTRMFRAGTALSPNVLNNIRPPGVIAQLDAALANVPHSGPPMTISGLLSVTEASLNRHFTFGLTHRFAAAFALLGFIGFHAERADARSTLRSHVDAQHACCATQCTAFVTEDRRLSLKAAVVYEFFGIATSVLRVGALLARLREGTARA